MIITRTPLRVSLGGGGTDIPSYYRKNGNGFLVAAAISRYVYVTVHDNFVEKYFLQYSKIENVDSINEIEHPLIREALRFTNTNPGIQISSEADIPAGTGLGSSGTFAVGLLRALYARQRKYISNEEIAKEACRLEIEQLNEPVGKQDQYIAAIGGLRAFEFLPNDEVKIIQLRIDRSVQREFEENLLLFFTGYRRSASAELRALDNDASTNDPKIIDNLDSVKRLGYSSADALESGQLDVVASLLTEQWKLKFSRSPSSLHKEIDNWISQGIEHGALGGKLIGAGGGGFILFYVENKNQLRKHMAFLGLKEVPISIDELGSVVLT